MKYDYVFGIVFLLLTAFSDSSGYKPLQPSFAPVYSHFDLDLEDFLPQNDGEVITPSEVGYN